MSEQKCWDALERTKFNVSLYIMIYFCNASVNIERGDLSDRAPCYTYPESIVTASFVWASPILPIGFVSEVVAI